MNRVVFLLSVAGILAIAAWAYGVNYRTTETLREIDSLRSAIAAAREDVQVLHVEWAYLNRPERLAVLVERHGDMLRLEPLDLQQFGEIEAIPYPPRAEQDPVAAALAAASSSILAQHGRHEGPRYAPDPSLLPLLPAEQARPVRAALRSDLPAFSMRNAGLAPEGGGRGVSDANDERRNHALGPVRETDTHAQLDRDRTMTGDRGERIPRPGDGPPPPLLDGERAPDQPAPVARDDGATVAEDAAGRDVVLPPRRPQLGAGADNAGATTTARADPWPERSANGVRLPPLRPRREHAQSPDRSSLGDGPMLASVPAASAPSETAR
ncbi:MAG: hypothetical protein AAF899_19325 [Pseudomonadota bacterium]